MTGQPRLVPVADHGVLVDFGGDISDTTLGLVHSLDAALARAAPAGMTETVPAMTSLLVLFDPVTTDHGAVSAAVVGCLGAPSALAPRTSHVIDVCYDPPHAPDLAALAERAGIGTRAVVDAHLGGSYTVGAFGFAPGFAYMYGTPEAIRRPRNPVPGPVVPAGSVIVAGQQCIITPEDMSTGWFAIGRSPDSLFTPDGERPFLFDVGDRVSFRRIDASELAARLGERSGTTR